MGFITSCMCSGDVSCLLIAQASKLWSHLQIKDLHLIEEEVAKVHPVGVILQVAAPLAEAQIVREGVTLLRVLLRMEQQTQLTVPPASEGMRMEQIPPAQVHLHKEQKPCSQLAM